MRIAVAAPSEQSANAALKIADLGGGAVDAAIAAAVLAMISEPGVVAPGAGGFLTICDPAGEAIVYDGYMAVPGLGVQSIPSTMIEATMEYGGGITTLVGPGSVAVPGAWAAFARAHSDHGRMAWERLFGPAISLAHSGVHLGATSAIYLQFSHESVFGHDPVSWQALHPGGDTPREGTVVEVPHLDETLSALATEGADILYTGWLAEMIASDLQARGSRLSGEDLAGYRAERRHPLRFEARDWTVWTNPPPAVGGAAVAAILTRYLAEPSIQTLISAQVDVFGWRRRTADLAVDRTAEIERLLATLPGDPLRSPSTAHVSVVDESGLACAITLSAGYGSGVIPARTGLWMNNALGELELVGDGRHLIPGTRLNSNMAPTVARTASGDTLAIGSPGADRITTAIVETLAAIITTGATLEEAVRRHRVHVDVGESITVAAEPGIDLPSLDHPVKRYDGLHMYFGGVGVARRDAAGQLHAASDPRRNGKAAVST